MLFMTQVILKLLRQNSSLAVSLQGFIIKPLMQNINDIHLIALIVEFFRE